MSGTEIKTLRSNTFALIFPSGDSSASKVTLSKNIVKNQDDCVAINRSVSYQ